MSKLAITPRNRWARSKRPFEIIPKQPRPQTEPGASKVEESSKLVATMSLSKPVGRISRVWREGRVRSKQNTRIKQLRSNSIIEQANTINKQV